MRRPKKVVLIGLDAMTLDFVDRYRNEAVLPNISKLMQRSFGIAVSGDFGFGQTGDHHPFIHTVKLDLGTMRAMTIFTGPGIKKNVRRKIPINLVDIAPTISALTDIPLPEKSEGKILYDIFQK